MAVDRLTADGALRGRLATAGHRYTSHYYRWPAIIDRYTAFLDEVVERGHRVPLRSERLVVPIGGAEYVRKG